MSMLSLLGSTSPSNAPTRRFRFPPAPKLITPTGSTFIDDLFHTFKFSDSLPSIVGKQSSTLLQR